jgi:hypothetical protein
VLAEMRLGGASNRSLGNILFKSQEDLRRCAVLAWVVSAHWWPRT